LLALVRKIKQVMRILSIVLQVNFGASQFIQNYLFEDPRGIESSNTYLVRNLSSILGSYRSCYQMNPNMSFRVINPFM